MHQRVFRIGRTCDRILSANADMKQGRAAFPEFLGARDWHCSGADTKSPACPAILITRPTTRSRRTAESAAFAKALRAQMSYARIRDEQLGVLPTRRGGIAIAECALARTKHETAPGASRSPVQRAWFARYLTGCSRRKIALYGALRGPISFAVSRNFRSKRCDRRANDFPRIVIVKF